MVNLPQLFIHFNWCLFFIPRMCYYWKWKMFSRFLSRKIGIIVTKNIPNFDNIQKTFSSINFWNILLISSRIVLNNKILFYLCLCYLWHKIIYFLFCVIVLSKKFWEKSKKFLFFKRRKIIFLCDFLCGKIIR